MQLPILMYHKVGAAVSTKADTFLNVSQRSFERQMRVLKRLGYVGMTFAEGIERLQDGKPLPKKPVCVTFDDGYVSVSDFAAPVLRQLGWPGTVFVPTAYVGKSNTWDEAAGYPLLPIMDWPQLKTLRAEGWEMAAHTRTHPRLGDIGDEEAEEDIRRGSEDLRSNLGESARTFCYPFGSYNPRTPDIVRDSGFLAACTTKSGLGRPSMDPLLLPRVKVAYRDDVWGFYYRLVIRPRLG